MDIWWIYGLGHMVGSHAGVRSRMEIDEGKDWMWILFLSS